MLLMCVNIYVSSKFPLILWFKKNIYLIFLHIPKCLPNEVDPTILQPIHSYLVDLYSVSSDMSVRRPSTFSIFIQVFCYNVAFRTIVGKREFSSGILFFWGNMEKEISYYWGGIWIKALRAFNRGGKKIGVTKASVPKSHNW